MDNESYSKFWQELSDIGKNVARCMEKYPETRNSDKKLYKRYEEEYPELDTSTATIERIRRKIQQKGFYMPSDEREYNKRRKARSVMFHKVMPKILKRDVQEIIADANGQLYIPGLDNLSIKH
jgi:predicted nuclease with TOPRIM domain